MVKGETGPALIGPGRAGEMVVNVVLPFFWTWGRRMGRTEVAQHARALYHAYPALEENQITREMRRLLSVSASLPISARRQQGMIHLYRGMGKAVGWVHSLP